MSEQIGHRMWAIAGSNIPLDQTGDEPDFTSHDSLWMLNPNEEDADVEVTIYYSDQEPKGPYPLRVNARRVREVRFNDLIDPAAIPLETDYGAIIRSDTPLVVQITQMDTRQAENTRTNTLAYPVS